MVGQVGRDGEGPSDRGERSSRSNAVVALLWALVVVILAFWIARNVPVFPLTLLAL